MMRRQYSLAGLSAFGFLAANLCCAMAPSDGPLVTREYQIKAAFLYNFAKFVDWPSSRFAAPDSPIIIGVLGDNPFGTELAAVVRRRLVNNRPIEIRFVATAAEAASVHILFAGAGQEPRLAAMTETLRQTSVLTVGETPSFSALGGIIDFVPEGDKVRFSIDAGAAERAQLKISSQLLKLAVSVHR